jgi:hypothetical protein
LGYEVRVIPPPINNNSSSVRSNTPSDKYTVARNSPHNHPSTGSDRTAPSPVILCISPAQDGGSFGFIHLSSREIINQAAIIAYFDSAGREVVVLPCPDFEGFLVANLLLTRNISFICDHPDYILTLGRQILEDNAFSNSNGCPDLSWQPQSPSVTSPSLSSKGPTPSVSRRNNVTIRAQHPPTPYQV